MGTTLNRPTSSIGASAAREEGFSLVEVLVSMTVLTVGLVSLAGVLALGVQRAAASAPGLIAREKAREAIESVHTARDTGALSWNRIENIADGGVFRPGLQPLRLAGPDGLVNTSDDPVGSVEEMRTPGKNGVLGDGDDVITPLNHYQRQIQIDSLMRDDGSGVNQNLRQITVRVQ